MKKIVFTFGRMNPPTIGHEKLANKIKSVAKSEKADARIYLSHTNKPNSDPLSYNDKIKFAKKAFGIAYKSNAKQIFQITKELYDQGYTDIVMVVGSDRVQEFETLLNKYNNKGDYNFDSIKVVSAGQRDPDAKGVEGMSGTKLRNLAKDGDMKTFMSGLASKLSPMDKKKVYALVAKNMTEEIEEERKPLTPQQRLAVGRRMKRLAPKIARIRKMKAKRMADPNQLKVRAQKAAIAAVRKRVAGEKGKNYKDLSLADRANVDKRVQQKSALVRKLSKKLIPIVRKKEQERLKSLRSPKNEAVAQDQDIKDREGTQPKKYYSGVKKSTKDDRDRAFKKGAEKDSGDPSAYPDSHPGDKGAKTKTSKYTKKYHQMYGDKDESAVDAVKIRIDKEKESDKRKFDRMMDRARLRDTRTKNAQTEEFNLSESSESALRKKADKSGISYGILKKVYDRGMAAWRTGHRPGATQQQWAYARVNSFITGGKTRTTADADLWKQHKGKSESVNEGKEGEHSWRTTGHYTADGQEWDGDQHVHDGQVMTGKTHTPDSQNLYHYKDLPANIRKKIDDALGEADGCWDGYKRVGGKMKGGKMVPNCVPEAVSPAQQAAIAIAKKKSGKYDKDGERIDENWFEKLMSKSINRKGYKDAAKLLQQVVDRKKKEGPLKHTIGYYANVIAREFPGVNSRNLQKMVKEEAGAGEEGTKKLLNKYKKDTPNEAYNPDEDFGGKLSKKKTLKAFVGNFPLGSVSPRDNFTVEETCCDDCAKESELIENNEYRVGSEKYFEFFRDKRQQFQEGTISVEGFDKELMEGDIGKFARYEGEWIPLDCPMIEEETEAQIKSYIDDIVHQMKSNAHKNLAPYADKFKKHAYKTLNPRKSMDAVLPSSVKTAQKANLLNMGEEKDVELNKPKAGGPKKYYVYVRDPSTGNVKKVTWGDTTGLKVKLNDKEARKSFAARHKCDQQKDRTKAAYWACNLPRYAKQLGLSGGGNFFW